jgi:hypothetical protein
MFYRWDGKNKGSELNHEFGVWRRVVWKQFTFVQKNPLTPPLGRGITEASSKQNDNKTVSLSWVEVFLISLVLCLMLAWFILRPWRWRQYLSPKLRYLSTRLTRQHIADGNRPTIQSAWRKTHLLVFPKMTLIHISLSLRNPKTWQCWLRHERLFVLRYMHQPIKRTSYITFNKWLPCLEWDYMWT